MTATGPHHLAKFDTTQDQHFDSEVVYRRCPYGKKTPPVDITDMFLAISWEDLKEGLSVNRSKYANPEDTLWSPIHEDLENKKCEYEQRIGIVYSSPANLYPVSDERTGVTFSLEHSPIKCNISHCDIKSDNLPLEPNKPRKRDIKAFLATLFQDIE